ncbi:hypothetical protein AOQ84DRAFT_427190 [Glonium stellatum]|uniref:Uncharacterized protein n=1 Tax=Glonium stellatum TaxID=574774 RepID=A0A8E2JV67_9PEZI|nr:hypothetical protein AOQ84DRAFT_427190 [Glonium stellatum]
MGAWGLGLFQSDYDYEVVDQLASEAGLRCSSSQQLLHPKDPDQVRRHLNSGILSALITKYMAIHSAHPSLRESKQDFATPSYKLVIIGALAMQLGCHLSKEFKAWLGGNYGKVGLMRDATKQMMEGLAVYENGKPHDFRSLGLNDTLAMDGPAAKDRYVFVLLRIVRGAGIVPTCPGPKVCGR